MRSLIVQNIDHEGFELILDRIFLDKQNPYRKFVKPLRNTPVPTIDRFQR